jgi:predicted nucleic acid-binding Zn ribbon protein
VKKGEESEGQARDGGPEHLSRILDRVLRDAGLAGKNSGAEILAAWREVAGPETGSHTSIYGFRAGVVTVAVDSAPLCQELELFRKEELLGALRARYRDRYVQDLRFRLV